MKHPSVDECKEWLENRSINPITHRSITKNGRIYRMFIMDSFKFGLISKVERLKYESDKSESDTSVKIIKCDEKWTELSNDEAAEYEDCHTRNIIPCGWCHTLRRLYFLHAVTESDAEDYICVRCGKTGALRYACFNCRWPSRR
jgi:hypothetical protein